MYSVASSCVHLTKHQNFGKYSDNREETETQSNHNYVFINIEY